MSCPEADAVDEEADVEGSGDDIDDDADDGAADDDDDDHSERTMVTAATVKRMMMQKGTTLTMRSVTERIKMMVEGSGLQP